MDTGAGVETAERIQDSVASVTEELLAAREYVFGTGPFGGARAKRIGRILDDLEGYYVRREIWLNRETFARLESLTAALRLRQRELASLSLSTTRTRTSSGSTSASDVSSTAGPGPTSRPSAKSQPTPSGACSG